MTYEGRLYDVTVLPKRAQTATEFVRHKYFVIEAEDAEEAAKAGAEFGEVLNVGFNTIRTVILKGGK